MRFGLFILCLLVPAAGAFGQSVVDNPLGNPSNPLVALDEASAALMGEGAEGRSRLLNILLMLTVLTLVPSVLLMCTCFTRVVIILGLLRQAIGTQGLPPGQVLTGLALFLSLYAMAPTLERVWSDGVQPFVSDEQPDYRVAWTNCERPMRDFMFAQIDATGGWSALYSLLEHRGMDLTDPTIIAYDDVPTLTLVPAFMLSELRAAFIVGFKIALPFLVIDLVVSSILISMGMMMLPPVLVSLPFKLLLFVLVDGWTLLSVGILGQVADPLTSMMGGFG